MAKVSNKVSIAKKGRMKQVNIKQGKLTLEDTNALINLLPKEAKDNIVDTFLIDMMINATMLVQQEKVLRREKKEDGKGSIVRVALAPQGLDEDSKIYQGAMVLKAHDVTAAFNLAVCECLANYLGLDRVSKLYKTNITDFRKYSTK